MERLARCEFSNREIQRELSDMHTKVNILVERSLGHMNAEPEFKNPFATSASASRSLTPSGGIGPSPLQTNISQLSTSKPDDLSQLSNRINSLQTSVGQLLALQTQQHLTSLQQGLASGQNSGLGLGIAQAHMAAVYNKDGFDLINNYTYGWFTSLFRQKCVAYNLPSFHRRWLLNGRCSK